MRIVFFMLLIISNVALAQNAPYEGAWIASDSYITISCNKGSDCTMQINGMKQPGPTAFKSNDKGGYLFKHGKDKFKVQFAKNNATFEITHFATDQGVFKKFYKITPFTREYLSNKIWYTRGEDEESVSEFIDVYRKDGTWEMEQLTVYKNRKEYTQYKAKGTYKILDNGILRTTEHDCDICVVYFSAKKIANHSFESVPYSVSDGSDGTVYSSKLTKKRPVLQVPVGYKKVEY